MTRIRRDYSRPLFSRRRRNTFSIQFVFLVGLMMGGFLVFISLNYNQVQLTALDAIGMAPTSTPFASDLASEGLARYQSGDMRGALVAFEQAARQQPDNVDYLFEYGWALMEDDRFDESIPVADQAIRVAPNDPRGYLMKARALMWTDSATAIQVSIQGLDVAPDYAPLYAVQGVAYTNLGRWQEGVRNGLRAVELDPNNAFVQRSLYFPMTYVGRFQDAIEALETAIEIEPNMLGAYFELARLYSLSQVNQPEMAVATYNYILENIDPNNAKAYLRLCETYANVEDARFDIAQPYCDEAIRIDPQYASAYRQRGQMQYNRRNYEGAIESFNQCVDYGSDEIECWYIRGLAHYWLGQCDDAWNVLTEARVIGEEQGIFESILTQIDIGLGNVQRRCPGYGTRALPTSPPPTAIPPTPIGGFG